MKYFTKEHEWIKPTENKEIFRVGISNYAQDQLGDVVLVELPVLGSEVQAGDTIATIESVKSANDIFVPITGEVVAVNEKLNDNPEIVNVSAEDEGWLCEIKINSEVDFDDLMSEEAYNDSFSTED